MNPSSDAPLRNEISPRVVLGVLRRRKLHFAVTVLIVAAGFTVAAFLLPAHYESAALVGSESLTTPTDAAGVSQDLEVGQRLAKIEEILHRRSVLEAASRKFDLYPDAAGPLSERRLDELKSRIQVTAEGPNTTSIGFVDRDRHRVAQVASYLASVVIDTTRSNQEQRAEERSRFLASQVEPVKERLDRQQAAIERYEAQWADELPDQVSANQKSVDAIQDHLQQISTDIGESEARLAAIDQESASLERQGVSLEPSKSATQKRLDEARAKLQDLEQRYTERHPDVVRARAEVERLESAIAAGDTVATTTDYSPAQMRYVELAAERKARQEQLTRARSQRASLLSERADYEQRIAAAPRHQAVLHDLQQEQSATREQYEKLLDQLHDAQIAERLQKSRAGAPFHLVEPAQEPHGDIGPHRLRILLMGLLAALGLGVGVTFIGEQTDTTFRDADELETAIERPVLATIPTLAGSPARPGVTTGGERIPMLVDPEGPAAEQYRMLATRLLRANERPGAMAVLVTGPVGGEGKTTTAVNLALALSHLVDQEILLVDADLRRPSIHRFFDLRPASGLRELLDEPESDPERWIRRHHGLATLEPGGFTSESRSALAAPRTQLAFQRLRHRFPYIVVDVSPLLPVADSLILQQVVDMVLLVVRARATSGSLVRRALHDIDRTRLVGMVLNDVDPGDLHGYSYAYPYTYGHPRGSAASAAPHGVRES